MDLLVVYFSFYLVFLFPNLVIFFGDIDMNQFYK